MLGAVFCEQVPCLFDDAVPNLPDGRGVGEVDGYLDGAMETEAWTIMPAPPRSTILPEYSKYLGKAKWG